MAMQKRTSLAFWGTAYRNVARVTFSAPSHFHVAPRSVLTAGPNAVMGLFCVKSIVIDRKSTRLNSSHRCISYAVFCLQEKRKRNRVLVVLVNHHRHPRHAIRMAPARQWASFFF